MNDESSPGGHRSRLTAGPAGDPPWEAAPRAAGRATKRRPFLRLAGAGLLSLAGCLEAPSSSPPPYETREIDDGACYAPGLRDERSTAFYAGLVTSDAESREFDLERLPRAADRAFVEAVDYGTAYLGVVQLSGVNSSTSIWLVDMAATPDQLGLVLELEDDPPHSEDRVITTFLVRVQKERPAPPERIWVQLSIDGRTERFSGS